MVVAIWGEKVDVVELDPGCIVGAVLSIIERYV